METDAEKSILEPMERVDPPAASSETGIRSRERRGNAEHDEVAEPGGLIVELLYWLPRGDELKA